MILIYIVAFKEESIVDNAFGITIINDRVLWCIGQLTSFNIEKQGLISSGIFVLNFFYIEDFLSYKWLWLHWKYLMG